MSEGKILKNGIPSFDATGNVTMIPQSNIASDSRDCVTYENPPIGWLRIAQNLTGQAMAGLLSVIGAPTAQLALLLQIAIGQAASFAQSDLSIIGQGQSNKFSQTGCAFSKIRVLKPGTSAYPLFIELYVSATSKTIRVRKSADVNLLVSGFANTDSVNPGSYAQIVYDLVTGTVTSSALSQSGGVKRCSSISYEIHWKGGVRHERVKSTDQLRSEGNDDRRNGVPWVLHGSRYNIPMRHIQYLGFHDLSVASSVVGNPLAVWRGGSHEARVNSLPEGVLYLGDGIPDCKRFNRCLLCLDRDKLTEGKEVAA